MSEPVLFEFTKDQLLLIVNNIASTPVQDFDVRFECRKASSNGICGEYVVPTITCRTEAEESLEFTLFVRRRNDTERGWLQAPHYSFLSKNGVPVPRLYGVLEDSQGREVLFLELLDEVTISDDAFYRDVDAVSRLLAIAGRLNGVKPTTDYAAQVGRAMAERKGYTRNWNTWLPWSIHILDRIEECAGRHLLGDELDRFCLSRRAEIQNLRQIALDLIRIVPGFPVGLVHGDFHPQNTGWRKKPRELVVFDFEDMMLDTRFYDAALVLGGPEKEDKRRARQLDLAAVYLDAYSQAGGAAPPLEEFLREISIVWFARKLNLWEYLPGDLRGPHYLPGKTGDLRKARLESLHQNLSMLVSAAGSVEDLIKSP
jgi:aminoglycoside phosphotransferase (APT) family kinase protein